MNRFEAANLGCLALLVAGAVAGAVYIDWPWWAVAPVAFFGGGWVVERTAPGTRLLSWLGADGSGARKGSPADGGRSAGSSWGRFPTGRVSSGRLETGPTPAAGREDRMGIEYRVRSAPEADPADALRRLPTAVERPGGFDFGVSPDGSTWPDATASVHADGIWFCDYLGGEGRRLLGELVAALAGYGPVTVEEL